MPLIFNGIAPKKVKYGIFKSQINTSTGQREDITEYTNIRQIIFNGQEVFLQEQNPGIIPPTGVYSKAYLAAGTTNFVGTSIGSYLHSNIGGGLVRQTGTGPSNIYGLISTTNITTAGQDIDYENNLLYQAIVETGSIRVYITNLTDEDNQITGKSYNITTKDINSSAYRNTFESFEPQYVQVDAVNKLVSLDLKCKIYVDYASSGTQYNGYCFSMLFKINDDGSLTLIKRFEVYNYNSTNSSTVTTFINRCYWKSRPILAAKNDNTYNYSLLIFRRFYNVNNGIYSGIIYVIRPADNFNTEVNLTGLSSVQFDSMQLIAPFQIGAKAQVIFTKSNDNYIYKFDINTAKVNELSTITPTASAQKDLSYSSYSRLSNVIYDFEEDYAYICNYSVQQNKSTIYVLKLSLKESTVELIKIPLGSFYSSTDTIVSCNMFFADDQALVGISTTRELYVGGTNTFTFTDPT